jgi:hypothetical protein
MPNAPVNAPKQIRTASVTSVRASAQAYEQSIFRKLWEKKVSKKVKPSSTPTLVNFTRKDSFSLTDSEVNYVDSSSDPDACPGGLPYPVTAPEHRDVLLLLFSPATDPGSGESAGDRRPGSHSAPH